MTLSQNRLRVLGSVYLVLVYGFGVLKTGAWSDDFPSLIDPYSHFLHAAQDGRPVYGWAIDYFFSIFTSVEGLKFIRLFGLIGLLLLSDAVLRFLFEKKLSNQVIAVSLVAFTLPSFQFSAHWAVAFGMSWTGFLAVQGLIYWEKPKYRIKIFGLLLFSSSLLIYPLMSFFVFSIAFLDLYFIAPRFSLFLHRLKSVSLILFFGVLFSSGFSRGLLSLLDLNYNSRVQIITISLIPEKIIWFITRPLALSYRPFLIDSPSNLAFAVQIAVSVLFLVVLIFSQLRKFKDVASFFILLNLNLILGLLPLLFVTQNQIDVRFLSANTWLVMFLYVNLIFSLLSTIFKTTPEIGLTAITVISSIVFIFSAWSVNDRYLNFIAPIEESSREFIAREIKNCSPASLKLGVEVVPRNTPWPSRNLLGMYSQVSDLASEWVPIGAVTMLLHDRSPLLKQKLLVDWGKGSSYRCVVDLNRFTESGAGRNR